MPDDSRIEIRITAESSGVQAGVTQAKTSLDQLRVSAADMAAALKNAGGDLSKISPAMLGVASASKEASAAIAASAPAAATAAAAIKATGAAAESAALQIHSPSTAIRELRAAFDEISSGRTRMLPGTLAIIGQRVLGLSPAALGATAAVAALAGGLGYLAVKSIEAENAIDSIKIGAEFAGDMLLTRDQIAQMADQLNRLPGISQSVAETIVGGFARMKDSTGPEVQALAAQIADFAQATGLSAEKAGAEWEKAFSNPVKNAKAFVESFHGVTQAQIDAADAAQKAENPYHAAAVMMQAFDDAVRRLRPEMDEHNRGILSSVSNWLSYSAAALAGMNADQYETAEIKDQNAQRQKQIALVQQAIEVMKTMPLTPQQTLRVGLEAGGKENKSGAETDRIIADIAKIQAAMDAAKNSGDTESYDKLAKDQAAAWDNLAAAAKRGASAETEAANKAAKAIAEAKKKATQDTQNWRDNEFAYWGDVTAVAAEGARKQAADLEKVARAAQAQAAKIEEAATRAAEKTQKEWDSALRPITTAFDGMLSGILRGTQTWQQATAKAAQNVALSYIESGIKIATDWAANQVKMTLQTAAGVAARTAAENAGNVTFLGQIAKDLAQWLGLETDKTGATVVGVAARTATITGESVIASGVEIAKGMASISISAAQAGAAAFADSASLGYYGLMAAPGVAAAAYGTTMGFAAGMGVASLDVGTVSVPRDMIAQIHQNEGIIPATFMEGIRSGQLTLGGPGAAGAGVGGLKVSMNVNAMDGRSVVNALRDPTTLRALSKMLSRYTNNSA